MDRNALYGCEMVLLSSLLALGIYWVFLEDASLASLRLEARESDRMLLSVGRRGSKERAGNSSQHVQSSRGSGRYPTRSPDHRLYSPGEGCLFPLQAGWLNALPRSRVFLDHYIPPRTPLFMAPLSLSIQSSPTFKAWLMGDRIANRKSLHADGPGF